jgi:hypothetical protein
MVCGGGRLKENDGGGEINSSSIKSLSKGREENGHDVVSELSSSA